jgi:transcriptional regulator with GAF, ATPase, and Fis domain
MAQQLPSAEDLREIFSRLGFVTNSQRMAAILQRAFKAALVSDATILLQGETGTGKQVLARAIHSLDPKRCTHSFVTLNCSTISEGVAESELFGHCKGAFSGAVAYRVGLFQAAEGGTIFLDDVNDLPLCLQPKLLDVLQRGMLRPLGSDREMQIHVRVIAAANRPLRPLVDEGTFRSDLFHRLNVIPLSLPPLRERVEDLPVLIMEFAKRYGSLYGPTHSLDRDLLQHLQCARFEGNVRELENAVQRMLFNKTEGTSLTQSDWLQQEAAFQFDSAGQDYLAQAANLLWAGMRIQGLPFRDLLNQIEGELLSRALQSENRTRRELAKMLHTSERTLYHKLKSRRNRNPTQRAAS